MQPVNQQPLNALINGKIEALGSSRNIVESAASTHRISSCLSWAYQPNRLLVAADLPAH